MTTPEVILRRAEFTPKVCTYWLLSGTVALTLSMVGICLLPVWWIVGLGLTQRYLKKIECVLTERSIKMKYGILTQVQKTVPLDKITDVATVEGPIMRALGVKRLTFETAGQSTVGATLGMVGIIGADDFREAVLAQRDKLEAKRDRNSSGDSEPLAPAPAPTDAGNPQLAEISDTLKRIETLLREDNRP